RTSAPAHRKAGHHGESNFRPDLTLFGDRPEDKTTVAHTIDGLTNDLGGIPKILRDILWLAHLRPHHLAASSERLRPAHVLSLLGTGRVAAAQIRAGSQAAAVDVQVLARGMTQPHFPGLGTGADAKHLVGIGYAGAN